MKFSTVSVGSVVNSLRQQFPPLITIGWILVALGAFVLTGWQTDLQAVQSVIPGTPRMSPLTAAALILNGVGFLLLHYKRCRLALILGAVIAVAGIGMLTRIFLHLPFAPDHILFPARTGSGMLSVNTAVNITLSGLLIAVAATRWRTKRAYIRGGSMLMIMLSLLAIITYLFGIQRLPDTISFIPMAINTSLGFFVVGLTMLSEFGEIFTFHIRKRVVWLFCILAGLILITSALAYQNVQKLVQSQDALQHRIDIQTALDGVLADTLNVEAGQRGYLLTGDTSYLAPYEQTYHSVARDVLNLLHATSNQPEQQALVNELIQVLQAKNDELQQTIQLQQSGQSDAAVELVRTNQGKHLQDSIRTTVDKLQARIDVDYTSSVDEARASVRRTAVIVVGTSVINILLIILVLQLILSEARERTRREEQLQHNLRYIEEQKAQDEALLSSIGDGVFALDAKGRIILFNHAASQITGFSEDEAIGQHYANILQFTHEESGKLNSGFIRRALSGRRAKMANHTMVRHKTGRLVPVADSAAPIFNPSKEIEGAIVVFRDVTQEYAIEKAKDEFVSLASHQLRTPATGVKQYLALILDGYAGTIDPIPLGMIKKAYASNERQLLIIQDMLDVAHVDSGRMVLDRTPTDLSAMLEDVVREQTATIRKRQQYINLRLPQRPVIATIDPARLRMVVENLVNNGSKYTPAEGAITVSMDTTAEGITISVQDTGVGIPQADLGKLFNKFTRLPNSLSDKVGGSGLGLYLADQIVELHGGTITVSSEPGKGSTFRVSLPIQRS